MDDSTTRIVQRLRAARGQKSPAPQNVKTRASRQAINQALRSTAKLVRTTFSTSRLLDFVSEKELTAQIGHARAAWPLVVVKELVDNSLDACEEAGTPPQIEIVVDPAGSVVTDNGPGIAAETVASILNFSSRVSSREAYVAPDRGAQGNALKTLIAVPFVLDGQQGRVELASRGIRHDISLRVDRIRQRPVLDHQQYPEPSQLVRNGTSVRLHWPNSPSSQDETAATPPSAADEGELEENARADRLSPSSLLHTAKRQFLQIANDFTFLNPHLDLALDWHGERTVVRPTELTQSKWLPSQPTCAHWYRPEHLGRLIAAYIAHDVDRSRDRTVREFVAEFAGLSSTGKQKAVLEATGLARTNLSELASADDLDMPRIEQLLGAMQGHSRRIKPVALGPLGRQHLEQRFAAFGCEMESFRYRRESGETDGLPWIVETAFAWHPKAESRRLITGINWSPGIVNPFRELGAFGESLDSVLQRQRAGRDEPVVLLLHLACPRVAFADRGKSTVVVEN